MYKYRLPIGDWSDDGHGKCEYFLISSKLPREFIYDADNMIPEVTGIDLSLVCSELNDNELSLEYASALHAMGFDLYCEDIYAYVDGYDGDDICNYPLEDCTFCMNADSMARLWVFLLNKVNPELEITLENDYPDTIYPSSDLVGYGVFSA